MGSGLRASVPLVGEFYDVDGGETPPLLFVATDNVDDDCVAVIRELKASNEEAAVIVLYTGGDPEQEISVLDAGADDCILVAFDFRHLSARLRAAVARFRRIDHPHRLACPIEVDPLTHQVRVDGHGLTLSPLEFRFLLELRQQRGKLVPYERLEQILWGETDRASRQSLKQLAHRLRLRLGNAAPSVVCVPGVGYILQESPVPLVTSVSPK